MTELKQCDCCARWVHRLYRRDFTGIETYACWQCCKMDGPEDDDDWNLETTAGQ